MADRKQLIKLAKAMVDVGKDLLLELKKEPALFNDESREKIIVKRSADRRVYIDGQTVIKKWSDEWQKVYGTQPYIEKKFLYMVVPLLKKMPAGRLLVALDNYFDKKDAWIEKQRHPFTLFVSWINKYLPTEGDYGRTDVGTEVGGIRPSAS